MRVKYIPIWFCPIIDQYLYCSLIGQNTLFPLVAFAINIVLLQEQIQLAFAVRPDNTEFEFSQSARQKPASH